MKTILKIKWENIMTILSLTAAIYSWVVYFKWQTETNMLVVSIMASLVLVLMLFNYKTIAQMRKTTLKLW